jgi:hypothetical protein
MPLTFGSAQKSENANPTEPISTLTASPRDVIALG